MIARNRIRCIVVEVGNRTDRPAPRGALARDLLPWADPYVAGLIKKLQEEVRSERRQRASAFGDRLAVGRREAAPQHDRFTARLAAEIDPSWLDLPAELGPAAGEDAPARWNDDVDDVPFLQ